MQKSLKEACTELLKKDLVNHYGIMRLLTCIFEDKKIERNSSRFILNRLTAQW